MKNKYCTFAYNLLRNLFFLVVFSIVFAQLTACNSENKGIATETLTVTKTSHPTATITYTPIHVITPTTKPTNTPKPTESPLVTQVLESPLGVAWYYKNSISHITYLDDGTNPLLIHNTFEDGVIVTNGMTGEVLNTFHPGKTGIDVAVSKDVIFLAYQSANDGENTTIEARHLPSGELIWQVTLPVVKPFNNSIFADSDGIVTLGKSNAGDLTLFYINPKTGATNWKKTITGDCYSIYPITLTAKNILYECDRVLYQTKRIDGSSEKLIDNQKSEENFDEFLAIDNTLFTLTYRWSPSRKYLRNYAGPDLELQWELKIPFDVNNLLSFNEDIIYRTKETILRVDGENGNTVWKTQITGKLPYGIILQDDYLLSGSGVGILSLLDASTGDIYWEQDIWATVEPRPIYLIPRAMFGNMIWVDIFPGQSFFDALALTPGGKENWSDLVAIGEEPPTTPEPTPYPVMTPPPSGVLPDAPEEFQDIPLVVTAFLNGDANNIARLDELFASWENSYSAGILSAEWKTIDLTGDAISDLLFNVRVGSQFMGDTSVGFIIIRENSAHYKLGWMHMNQFGESTITALVDLNKDRIRDLVYTVTEYGASFTTTQVFPIAWNGSAFINLAKEDIETFGTSTVEVQKNINNEIEIVVTGGYIEHAPAGHTRNTIDIYSWQEDGIYLKSREPIYPQDYFFFLVDAGQKLKDGDPEGALEILKSSENEENYYYRDDSEATFIEMQFMLAYLLIGDEESARVWAESGHYPDEFYTEIKELFWQSYLQNKDYTTAAEEARTAVRLAGIFAAQPSEIGYLNEAFQLEDIIPCSECLQGPLGSLFVR